tara:strand:- start:551 stop:2311 length:1761 start_codon:yes stop_codon:yes gene_type:complete
VNKHNLLGLSITFLLVFVFIPSQSIETNDFPSYLNEMEITIPIEIHVWSDRDGIKEFLETNVHANIIQESEYPRNNSTDIWQVRLNNNFYGLNNKIDYTFISHTSELKENVSASLLNNSNVNVNFADIGNFTGIQIPSAEVKDKFNYYSSENTYSIHLLDLNYYSGNDISYWFNHGLTSSINSLSQDMRNIIHISPRSIVVDPTAIAPYFGHAKNQFSDQEYYDYSLLYVNKIIETCILGSPQSFNLLSTESTIQLDRIVISNDTSDPIYSFAARSSVYQGFELQVENLFPYFTINQKVINSDINDVPTLVKLLNDYTQIIDNQSTIIVDFNFAEAFKNIIRNNYHSKYPSQYYYSIVLFADSERRYMMNLTQNGNPTNKLVEYNVGEIGFSMDSLSDWYEIENNEVSTWDSLSRSLQVLGKNFGLANLADNISSQIESPMSSYGVSSNWNYQFNQVEIDQIQRRHYISFMSELDYELSSIIQSQYYDYYFWLEKSNIQVINSITDNAKLEALNLNYTGAIELIKIAQNTLEIFAEDFQRSFNFIYYGVFLLVTVIFLAYYSKILFEESISKDEFLKRLKNNRKNN